MKTSYEGKTALITGGSSGIGLAIAKELAAEGAHIWILGRDQARLQAACIEISKTRKDSAQLVLPISADVSDYEALSRALDPFLTQYGTPDLLFNSAGITYPGLFTDLDLNIFRQMMDVNFYGTLYVTRLVVPGMIQRGSGHIINFSSLVGIHNLYGYSAYGSAKFAVTGLSDSLRYELKEHGVQVSVVFPTDTKTPQLEFESQHKPPVLKALTEANNTPVAPELVAKNILKNVRKGKYFILPTSDGALLYSVTRFFPGNGIYRVVDLLMAQARSKAAKENRR